jgi:peptidyl-tRNA hydrolase, PTH1 family
LLLLCGLGNKGSEYAFTRHNIGYLVVDRYSERFNLPIKKKDSGCRIGLKDDLILAKPDTYMNLSGSPVAKLVRKFHISPDSLIVIHDDLDMDFGKMRIRLGGRDGGHKGVRSIIESLGSSDFYRLKIGIGRNPAMPAEEYVLSRFEYDRQEELADIIAIACDALKVFIDDGASKAMSLYNKRGPE